MDNLSPKRTTKTHAIVGMMRLNSIGFGPNAMSARWDAASDAEAAAEAETAKTEFQGSLPEDIRGNEAIVGFSNAGEIATAYLDTKTKLDAKPAAGWKGNIKDDVGKAPFLEKFEDTPAGLTEAIKSHHNLEKLLGHEKVPIPKDEKDVEGWARFNKAMGKPDTAEGYALPDVKLPEGMEGQGYDKKAFAEQMHKMNATPAQAKGLWKAYTEMTQSVYTKAMGDFTKHMGEVTNQLRGEWGDAYEGNIQLGQLVINKFTANKEENDFVTATLSKNPLGSKFLAKIGMEFAENKLGEFAGKRFDLTPDEIEKELNDIRNDPNHPYRDEHNKATAKEHQAAVEHVLSLEARLKKIKDAKQT